MRTHGSAQQLEQRRRNAIALLDKGCSPQEVVRRLRVSLRSVQRWRQAVRENGKAVLAAVPHPGRASFLSDDQKEDLVERLVEGEAVARLRQRSVDLPTGEAPDRPLVRCFVPCRPCVAAVAESRLHSAKALASGGGTRRRGHRDLGPQGLATHQKKTAQLGRTSFSRMKPAFC